MNVEWKMRPYFGVFPLVFSALIHKTKSIYTTGTLKCSAVIKKLLAFAKYSLVAELPKYTAILEYLHTQKKKIEFRVARSQQHLQVYLPLKTLSCSDWGVREIEWDHFQTNQITHSCYAPALPSPQLCETPAGKGSPST